MMSTLKILLGTFIFFSFPFFVVSKIKDMRRENTEEVKKKINLFLICMTPVPIVAIALILSGLKAL